MLFLPSMSEHCLPAAMAELVRGGVVELTVELMTAGELDMFACGLVLVPQYVKDALGQQTMCAPRLVDQLVKWIAKWIKKVRGAICWLVSA